MKLPAGAVLRQAGDSAFVVEFGDTITEKAGLEVAALAAAFDDAAPPGVVEVVPTFRSLLIVFDPDRTDAGSLIAEMPEPASLTATPPATWRLPVAMEGEAAEDLAAAAEGLGLAPDVVRERFLSGTYHVGMYGFAPGFAYLSGVDESLAIPRRASPRPPMPAGSIILAGGMAALTSQSMPTGWYVIGRTAITLFRPSASPMVPFQMGDTITFRAVPEDALGELSQSVDGGLERMA